MLVIKKNLNITSNLGKLPITGLAIGLLLFQKKITGKLDFSIS